jgi:tol-pal system protein YbgF
MMPTTHRARVASSVMSVALMVLVAAALSGCGSSEELMQAQSRVAALEQQVEELRSENTSLAQKNLKLDQDNKSLMARLADTEEKLMAERERAEKAKAVPSPPEARKPRETAPPPPPPGMSMAMYEAALNSFNMKHYDAAIQQFEVLLRDGVDPDLEDNCHYWLGESYFGKRSYQDALRHFEMVMGFRGSEKMADAQFMIAQSYERIGDKARAKQAYEVVVKDFPTSEKVKLSKERWGKL